MADSKVLSKSFFLVMAQIFDSSFMKKDFENLYQVIIPSLNERNNCGILKCFYCIKFTESCSLCRAERCKNCFRYTNAIEFFYEHAEKNSGIKFLI